MSKRSRPWTRQQREAIRRRTAKPAYGCSQCGYRQVCWDGLCMRCSRNGFIGPNERAIRDLERKVMALVERPAGTPRGDE